MLHITHRPLSECVFVVLHIMDGGEEDEVDGCRACCPKVLQIHGAKFK